MDNDPLVVKPNNHVLISRVAELDYHFLCAFLWGPLRNSNVANSCLVYSWNAPLIETLHFLHLLLPIQQDYFVLYYRFRHQYEWKSNYADLIRAKHLVFVFQPTRDPIIWAFIWSIIWMSAFNGGIDVIRDQQSKEVSVGLWCEIFKQIISENVKNYRDILVNGVKKMFITADDMCLVRKSTESSQEPQLTWGTWG